MENNRRTPPAENGRADTQEIYALLRSLKSAVDRLSIQVKRLNSAREGKADE